MKSLAPSNPVQVSTESVVTRSGRSGGRRIRMGYDAAKSTLTNVNQWSNADLLSGKASTTAEIRQVLRSRARYEGENNGILRGIYNTLADDTVGTGPRAQLTGNPNEEALASIERRWRQWQELNDIPGKLRLMRISKAESGEVFGLMAQQNVPNPRRSGAGPQVGLGLRLIEADQIETPTVDMNQDPDRVSGMEHDSNGNVTHYHVLKTHPGDEWGDGEQQFDRIPARNMIHYWKPDRPGQCRGITEIATTLERFGEYRAYIQSVLLAAKTAASLSALLSHEGPMDAEFGEGEDDYEPFDTVEIPINAAMTLPSGTSITQMKAEQPITTFTEFRKSIINEMARPFSMPLNVALGDSSDSNYASGRLDHQVYHKAIRVERKLMERQILVWLFWAWFDEGIKVSGYFNQAARAIGFDFDLNWHWDGFGHVDPLKEAKAESERLDSGAITYADLFAAEGKDWKEQFKQRAIEQQEMEKLGITVPRHNAAPTPEKTTADQDDDE